MDLPLSQIVRLSIQAFPIILGANPGETEREFSGRRATELDQLIKRLGPDSVAAPSSVSRCSAPEALRRRRKVTGQPIQAVLKKHDVLLIADEVITGFGRTGSMFGSEHYGIEPDLITIAGPYLRLLPALRGNRWSEGL